MYNRRLNEELYITYESAGADKLLPSEHWKPKTELHDVCRQDRAFTRFIRSTRRLALHGGSRLSKTDPLRSSAGFRGFLCCSRGTFPRITLIHNESIHRGKTPPPEELPLPSIQLPGPLISARTAHNEKERLALTSSTGICDDDNG